MGRRAYYEQLHRLTPNLVENFINFESSYFDPQVIRGIDSQAYGHNITACITLASHT